jgi:hypothetical protein
VKSDTSLSTNNRSSPYFICDICGKKFENEYEISLHTYGLLKSNQGVFCNKHVNISRVGKYIRKILIAYYYNSKDTINSLLIYNLLLSFDHSYGIMKYDSEKRKCLEDLIDYIKINTDKNIGETYFYTWYSIAMHKKAEIPDEICPIYNMDCILYNDLLRYSLINKDLYESLVSDIKKSFSTYKEFSKHLNEEN